MADELFFLRPDLVIIFDCPECDKDDDRMLLKEERRLEGSKQLLLLFIDAGRNE